MHGLYDDLKTYGGMPIDAKSGDWVLQLTTCCSTEAEMLEMKAILIPLIKAINKKGMR